MDGRRAPRRLATIIGLAAGALAGVALAALADVGTARRADDSLSPRIEATHLPPLLTVAEERVELRYDAYCLADEDVEAACDIDGVVHLRQGDAGAFGELALAEDRGASEGRLVATVPSSIARSPAGFSYYAVLRDRGTGATVTLPAGGSAAPQRSRPLGRAVEVSLGGHRFGEVRRASARAAAAPWGSGRGAVGLEQGRQLTPIGGSSFDVGDDGAVHVLDEANRRVLRWRTGTAVPDELPVTVNGTIADLGVADDGTLYVLETTSQVGEPLALRAFDARGRATAEAPLVERAAQIRVGPGGDVVALQQPSGQWMTVVEHGRSVTASRQRATGRSGRPLRDSGEMVVLRGENELRVALTDGRRVQSAWRITSSTPLAEVQLAERLDRHVLLVLRVYTDVADEFQALVLGERGLVDSFSLASADWAETAPLSRFRLRGSTLYQLGSTPNGMFVDRFDLEVR